MVEAILRSDEKDPHCSVPHLSLLGLLFLLVAYSVTCHELNHVRSTIMSRSTKTCSGDAKGASIEEASTTDNGGNRGGGGRQKLAAAWSPRGPLSPRRQLDRREYVDKEPCWTVLLYDDDVHTFAYCTMAICSVV
jgi:hypothetical protein